MSDRHSLTDILQSVDVGAATQALYREFPPSVRHLASSSTDQTRTPRTPRLNNCIQQSSHCPHVLASDRLLLCNYGAGLLQFTQYCDQLNIPEENCMPASETLLTAFSAHAAGSISLSALNNWLAGLHFWHTINGAPWHGHEMLHHVRRGVTKLVPISSKHTKRPPVTIEALLSLCHGLDLTNSLDASLAFWLCCCLGELIIPSTNLFLPRRMKKKERSENCVIITLPAKHVSRSVIPLTFHHLPNNTVFTTFHIPWTKTTLQDGADISVTARAHPTCPITALKHHLVCNAKVPDMAPLFASETANGSWAPLTRLWFLNRCNAVWLEAGYPDMLGHAFQIGGTTELLLQGINPDIIATQGCWHSRAFLLYWHRIESILPLFLSASNQDSSCSRLLASIDTFHQRHGISAS
ncbi:hypothetical protein SERLADRAFT_368511 [Serpula lacrymans var. lacrymans S7.9]|uniref:DNA breaking-rejoining enzyme n=1 Tax=Serpula lacrymans var. lacrymans (strain S7.9) TaxID=578457 RepID=F8NQ64_SERL9|nr:uncharacterized protein SERLADRAFT_368511 [Serpula lacrymans var. lacrymans S7.9]EGO27016.1 hypothetical protein SERLADRAFT_368511 [Serpula lacrymans var. lacrymans S7.9]